MANSVKSGASFQGYPNYGVASSVDRVGVLLFCFRQLLALHEPLRVGDLPAQFDDTHLPSGHHKRVDENVKSQHSVESAVKKRMSDTLREAKVTPEEHQVDDI